MSLNLKIRIEIKDKDGKVIKDTGFQKCHTYTPNFINFLTSFLAIQCQNTGDGYLTMYVPSTENVYLYSLTGNNALSIKGVVGDDTRGIVVYSGSRLTDSEIKYMNQHWTWLGIVGSSVQLVLSRAFSNKSGGPINLTATGIRYKSRGQWWTPGWWDILGHWHDGFWTYEDFFGLFAEDTISDSIPNDGVGTIQYLFETSVGT